MGKSRIPHKALLIAMIEADIPSIPALAEEIGECPTRIYEMLKGIGLEWPSKRRLMVRIAERLDIDNPADLFPAYREVA